MTCANQTACDFLSANTELDCKENVQCTRVFPELLFIVPGTDYQNLAIGPGSEIRHSVSFSWVSKNHQVQNLLLAETMLTGGSSSGEEFASTELVHKITILILSRPFCMNLKQDRFYQQNKWNI